MRVSIRIAALAGLVAGVFLSLTLFHHIDVDHVHSTATKDTILRLEAKIRDLELQHEYDQEQIVHLERLQEDTEQSSTKQGSHEHRDARRSTLTIKPPQEYIHDHKDTIASPIRICLLTSAISGPTSNGGIATAFYSMARHLAGSVTPGTDVREFDVTVLYAAHPYYSSHNAQYWTEHFAQSQIKFVPLREDQRKYYGPKFVARAYRAFEHLRQHQDEFDIISFHDFMGSGYYITMSKQQGLAFQNVFLHVQCHSTIRWADDLNHRAAKDHNTLAYYHMEQKSLEWADARVSPSSYYLSWMNHTHFNLSYGTSIVTPNLLFPKLPDQQTLKWHQSSHFVFFARLEVRKGLLAFCDALDYIVKTRKGQPSLVSFIGPNVNVDGSKASTLIKLRAQQGNWKFRIVMEHDFNTAHAMRYIKERNGVVVLPTLGDNSPYAVLEIVANNLPLITTDAGGGVELLNIKSKSGKVIVPAGDSVALAESMMLAMTNGIWNVATKVSFSKAITTYKLLLHSFRASQSNENSKTKRTPKPAHKLKVTVGITSKNRPQELIRSVRSIANQSYNKNLLELVIVDDASDDRNMELAFSEARKILDTAGIKHQIHTNKKPQYVSHTRNHILELGKQSNSDYVCFLDDDDEALPYMIAIYMRVAAHSHADVLTDFSDNYDVDSTTSKATLSHRSLAVGNAFGHNFFINNYGKANFCTKPRKALEIGGHQTDEMSNSPYVDWGFFTRASLHDLHIEIIPLALYKYYKNSEGSIWYGRTSQVDRFNGHGKMLNDITDSIPSKFRDVLKYCRYHLGKPSVAADGPM